MFLCPLQGQPHLIEPGCNQGRSNGGACLLFSGRVVEAGEQAEAGNRAPLAMAPPGQLEVSQDPPNPSDFGVSVSTSSTGVSFPSPKPTLVLLSYQDRVPVCLPSSSPISPSMPLFRPPCTTILRPDDNMKKSRVSSVA